jgi:hypothetical protein
MEELEEEKRQATLEKERQSLQILERIKLQSEHDNMTKAEMARLRHLEKIDMVTQLRLALQPPVECSVTRRATGGPHEAGGRVPARCGDDEQDQRERPAH